MNNLKEHINGRLCKMANNEWIVASGYGNFHLNSRLAAIMQKSPEQTEGEVEAMIEYGLVTQYHFANEFMDKAPD